MKVYIMVGIPGSGKSTRAREIASAYAEGDCVIHSTDNYFMKNGAYCFNPALLGVNHQKNLEAFELSVAAGVPCVIVDNTNIRPRDRKPYRAAAEDYGYEVEEVVVGGFDEAAIKLCAARNTHGVPEDAIRKMAERYLASNS